jgi:hypothetical protein
LPVVVADEPFEPDAAAVVLVASFDEEPHAANAAVVTLPVRRPRARRRLINFGRSTESPRSWSSSSESLS